MENNDKLHQLKDIHYPRWEELPEFELYMDQVITLLNKYLNFLIIDPQDIVVTNTMINNYVKLKLIPKPKKKKYTRIHLAYLIAILSLKQVLSIQQVKLGIEFLEDIVEPKNAYNYFCTEQENAFNALLNKMDYDLINIDVKLEKKYQWPIKMAAIAMASKTIALYTLNEQKNK